ITAFSVLDGSSCGRLNVNTRTWEAFPCDASLPYICKKPVNSSADDSSDYWHYSETTCDGNWTAYNGFCYLQQQPEIWEGAELSCQKENGSLISLHSLADVELDDGMLGTAQKNQLLYARGLEKRRLILHLTLGAHKMRFEQEFLNSLMKEQANSEGRYFWTNLIDTDKSGDYYWQTAGRKKDLSYSNWNTHEPAFSGGCVAMSGGGDSLGKWEVKDCKQFKARSICKRGIGSAQEEDIPKPNVTTCPDGWHSGSGMYCYKISSTILDEFQEEDYFLRDCAALEIFAPMQRNVWTWHFAEFQPQEYNLQPFHCEALLELVCQVAKGVVPKTPQWYQPELKKPGTTLPVNGAEYWFVSEPRLGHKEAELFCAVNGSELAVIDSYDALTAIQDYLRTQGEKHITTLLQKWWVKYANVRSRHE
ncbi:hypothetical protein AB205_0220100, partial [Aquarana catesbeiana]